MATRKLDFPVFDADNHLYEVCGFSGKHFPDRILQIFALFDLARGDVVGLGNFDKIRIHHLRGRVALFMEKLLPLSYHSEETVVQHQDLNSNFVLHDRSQFLQRHLKSTISDNGNSCS